MILVADLLVQYLTWLLFLMVFAFALAEAVRHPGPTNIDVALAFGASALIVVIGVSLAIGLIAPGWLPNVVSDSLRLALPYLLLRLVDDFSGVDPRLLRLSQAGLATLVAGMLLLGPPKPPIFTLLAMLYFVGLQAYVTFAFVVESHRTVGVTRRRIQSVAAGSILLGLATLEAGAATWLPTDDWGGRLFELLSLASGLGFFLGFAPPRWVRYAWQEPELRPFLRKVPILSRLPETVEVIREIEEGVALSLGAPNARIVLWDEAKLSLVFEELVPGQKLGECEVAACTTAFNTQRATFSSDVPAERSSDGEKRRTMGATTVLSAPITADTRRIGVLVAYAPRAPVFARDDLELLRLLADQSAAVLESHRLVKEAAEMRAREEVTLLKEEFLAAAAHDLKTPLTSILGYAQMMRRVAERNPEAHVNLESVDRIVYEGRRMTSLINSLLDASRAERGLLLDTRQPVDLARVAQEVCGTDQFELHRCDVEARGEVIGLFDRVRVTQLIENLVGNAAKYSPPGSEVNVRVWSDGELARVDVADQGIGIPPEDLPHIFDRFHRGRNVGERHVSGMGLGLFIARRIVEEHGGQIWASSTLGKGSTFHVELPTAPAGQQPDDQIRNAA